MLSKNTIFALVTLAYSLPAFADPDIVGNYVCTQGGQTANLEVFQSGGKYYLRSDIPGTTEMKDGLPCLNDSQTATAGDTTVSYVATCTDTALTLDTHMKIGKATNVQIDVSFEKTAEDVLELKTTLKGKVNKKSVHTSLNLTCLR